ncbi:Nif3-like dinuclear metal center hexameric protein [Mucilaginibacter sp. BJC16-A38]|uniref:Nif3-like dinuclear metal center hexameric protein n=1 Tax=Mucilaginibacter phenanthrenivorans TaxID=1234842 RepID=UPI0021578EF1|nr:Nif3-like dinuclear metal center hexameric protein [Mucilaginibacter phenanthrenivorans]MCR8559083.1 Nif3-like dinuclear metal center hexameric protein [Mucilaginibacter phenanthrenivorans]
MSDKPTPINHPAVNRRTFVANTAKATGLLMLAPLVNRASGFIKADETYTVGQIMDLFIKQVPGGVKATTVDTLKSGSRDLVVTGIVTAMFATIDVIRKAIELGANFIIVHEPTFYNHLDDTSWLQNDDIYRYKADLLKKHNIAIWRNHDYIHTIVPDGVTDGVLDQLEWKKYADKTIPNILSIPQTSLREMVGYVKGKLGIEMVRYIGDPSQPCSHVLFMPGAAGGQRQIQSIAKIKPDVMICGEISEWETAEYVRDARAKGDKTALVVLGHIASEDAGSEFMLNWVRKNVPSVKAARVKPGNSLSFM